ncbi:choline dehydrogenase [Bosea sp. 117]|uniref:choline dehydrogenase n=1 Tax=Bosea sp. 117 TaxID=1125973 RepID=UPI000494C81F|nr:choline dehydrogenase [Bosea sp. 117]
MIRLARLPEKSRYDYVVVGSGSAGSVVAARLAEDASSRVLLLEAGPSDEHIYIKMPAALGFPLMNDRFNWFYNSEPEPYLKNRIVHESRGRVLGGSSSINGMNWVRGNPADYDGWEARGLPGWSYAHVLPYFRKAETFASGGDTYRGATGPMRIERCEAKNPLYRAFLEAGVQAGHEYVEDHNAYRQEGVHITQRNVGRGLRWNTSRAYLHEGPVRPNLTVAAGVLVTRIGFDGRTATHVHARQDGRDIAIEVAGEVILAAGALNSPQLLLLSGVGPAAELSTLGIPVVADIPGVGAGLKDHVAAPVQYIATKDVSAAKALKLFGRAKLGLQWLLFKKGLGATNFFEVGGFIRTDPSYAIPNIQYEFVPMLGELQHGSVDLKNGFQYFLSLMRPTSSGRVWIDSADPARAPKFVFNFLKTEEDRQQMVAAVKETRRIIAQQAWDEFRGEEVTPGPQVRTDEQILDFLLETAGTNYHPCCSARMGTDDMSVVDVHGKVHGIENLRVVDASIMPDIVSGNLNAPVIMMAEKLADDIRGRALPPEAAPFHRPSAQAA